MVCCVCSFCGGFVFFFKQKTAYEMRISDWSSDVCSSDLPSPLYYAEPFTKHLGGAKIYFKREELNHTGAHKINNCIGQILLAKRMGKKRIIAETGDRKSVV